MPRPPKAKSAVARLGLESDPGKEHADTFRNVQYPDLRADDVLANPPFNDSDWFRKDDDVRWQFGIPPKTARRESANTKPEGTPQVVSEAKDNMAGFVLANGSMSSNQSGEGDIRKVIIEADLVDCMVALPGQLFYSVVKRFVLCRMIHWIKRLNILGSFAEIRSQGARISAPLKIQMPFSPVIAAQLS